MSIVRRDFPSYEEYVFAQGGKARDQTKKLLADMPRNVVAFSNIFSAAKRHLCSGPMLCLGARTGAEMVAAEACGFKGSVGIDLHPVGPGVRQGDWHALPEFADGSFPNIYTNSFDHCLFLEKAAAEVLRLLPGKGVFYLMASDKGLKNAERSERWLTEPKHNEALFWHQADDLRDALLGLGFEERSAWRTGFWSHYILGKKKAAEPMTTLQPTAPQ